MQEAMYVHVCMYYAEREGIFVSKAERYLQTSTYILNEKKKPAVISFRFPFKSNRVESLLYEPEMMIPTLIRMLAIG